MKRWIERLSSIGLLFFAVGAVSQDIPLGTWRTHFSFQNTRLVASGDGKVFCAAENGIFFLDLSNNSINKLSKLNGLSDVGATSLIYDESTQTLLIGYGSGLIDLVTSEEVKTIRAIHETNLSGIKTIRDIVVHQDRAYVATSFGIVVVSTESKEIVETFRSIGPDGSDPVILDLEIRDGQIFAITDHGIQSGDLTANLLDFNNWDRYNETSGKEFDDLAAVNGKVYAIVGNSDIAVLQDDVWTEMHLNFEEELVDLHSHEHTLYVLSDQAIYSLEDGDLVLREKKELSENANSFIFYQHGFWIADGENGLINPEGLSIIPNGPLSDNITRLSFTNEKLFALFGPADGMINGQIDSLGYSYFDNQTWRYETISGFYNLTDVEAYNQNLYFSSAGFGLYNQTSGEVINHTNSLLKRGWTELGPVITELEKHENLYLLSNDTISSLYVMDKEHSLTAYSAEYLGAESPVSIRISENGILWVVRNASPGEGIILLDLEGDEYRVLTTSSELPSNVVNDVVIYHNDDALIATAGGPALFPDASFPFDGFSAIRPIFENRELFEDENISAIAVDGGNRVWISTGTGVYLFNENLTELIQRFTVENSPLPSHNVRQFAYNGVNGEMYILTEHGMVSFRSGSSAGAKTHRQVNIFPNPVRPGYSGQVGIDGLVTNASVKITDVNGKLIRQLQASGGTASWDLLDYNMNRVSTGIYVILSASADGEETFIGKIAVIN